MTITADALRSGIRGMSAYSRISIENDKLGKAGFRQSIACHFNKAESQRLNQDTINALKTAVLNDPRYSGIQDKVDAVFDGLGSKHAIRAKDVKKAFSDLDKCAFKTEAGRRSFLVQDIKMRLMAGTFSSSNAKTGAGADDAWAFSFKNEWKSGNGMVEDYQDLIQWAQHFKKLEPLMGKMVDVLAERRGGVQNITAADARELSWQVHSMLAYIGKSITNSSISEKHYYAAFKMTANILANSPKALSTPLAALQTADEIYEVLNKLAAFENSFDGSKFAVENGIAWMDAMCAPLSDTDSTFLPFVENHMDFECALKLGLPPDKARRLTSLACWEFYRTSRTTDMAHELLDANSFPRQLLNFPDLAKTDFEYRNVVPFLGKLDRDNVEPDIRNLILESMSATVREVGKLPDSGSVETVTSNGEHLRLEWSLQHGISGIRSIDQFDQVA